MAFSPDGSALASGSREASSERKSGEIKLWDVKTVRERASLSGYTGSVHGVVFSPDGRTLATTGSDKLIHLWEVGSYQERAFLVGHSDQIWSLAFRPDGQCLASTGWDGTVLWDLTTKPDRATLPGRSLDKITEVYSLAFTPDGNTLAGSYEDSHIRLWNTKTGQPQGVLKGHKGGVWSVAISSDGFTLASASIDKTVRLWNIRTQELQKTLQHPEEVSVVAFSPKRGELASGGEDKVVRLWDVESGQQRVALEGHTGSVSALAYSPDGTLLASSSLQDQTVRLWDVKTGKTTQKLDAGRRGLAFSPDGVILAVSLSNKVILWNLVNGKKRVLTVESDWSTINAIAFSPNGRTLAVACGANRPITLWDVASGEQTTVLPGYDMWLDTVAFSPDGKLMASAGNWDMVRLWNLEEPRGITAPVVDWHSRQADKAEDSREWFTAAFHLNQLLRQRPNDTGVMLRLGVAQASLADLTLYRRTCRDRLEAFVLAPVAVAGMVAQAPDQIPGLAFALKQLANVPNAATSARICVLRPDAVDRPELLKALTNRVPRWLQGAILCRLGEHHKALDILTEQVKQHRAQQLTSEAAVVELYLALAEIKLGHLKEARDALQWALTPDRPESASQRQELDLLIREVRSLLEK
jgi:WD40 repeat protein